MAWNGTQMGRIQEHAWYPRLKMITKWLVESTRFYDVVVRLLLTMNIVDFTEILFVHCNHELACKDQKEVAISSRVRSWKRYHRECAFSNDNIDLSAGDFGGMKVISIEFALPFACDNSWNPSGRRWKGFVPYLLHLNCSGNYDLTWSLLLSILC